MKKEDPGNRLRGSAKPVLIRACGQEDPDGRKKR